MFSNAVVILLPVSSLAWLVMPLKSIPVIFKSSNVLAKDAL